MGKRLVHSVLLKKGGIQQGSEVEYLAKEDESIIDFRSKQSGSAKHKGDAEEEDGFENVSFG